MVDQPSKSLHDLVQHVGKYPVEAFLFVREGLDHTAKQVHGPEADVHKLLHRFLGKSGLDWSDLEAQFDAAALPEPVMEAIRSAGGLEKLNRHVSGRDLCWGLRDLALQRWGLLAPVVLSAWNIRCTTDFGRIVFGFIDFDLMRKQNHDSLDDFSDVFSFHEGFDEPFRAALHKQEQQQSDA